MPKWLVWLGALLLAVISIGALTVLRPLPVRAAANNGLPGDTNIKYFGRWDTGNNAVYKNYWGGAYFKVGFSGTRVQIKVGGAVDLYAWIDGTESYYPGASGTVNLTPVPLAPGVHTLKVASAYFAGYDGVTETGVFQFQGLVLDAGAMTSLPPASDKLIEFAGDSITAGMALGKQAISDYAWLSAEQLGYEHTQIAHTGINLVDNWTPNNLTTKIGLAGQFFKLQNGNYTGSPDWNFSAYPANMVVVNIGTNDYGTGVPSATFKSNYTAFLQNILQRYPSVVILAMRPFNGAFANEIYEAVHTADPDGRQIFYIDTSGWISKPGDYLPNDQIHPNDSGHVKIKNRLAEQIRFYEKYTNLALKKPAVASSSENASLGPASAALDGDLLTRWASAASDPQWIYTDLGTALAIGGVKLRWETAYGKSYKIQVSGDALSWTDVYATTTGDGGADDISFPAVNGRYVRMLGLQRGTGYGYSLYEFEVHAPKRTGMAPAGSTIWLKSVADGKYVTVTDSNQLRAVKDFASTWEQFLVEDAGGGYIALKSLKNNLYVSALGDAAFTHQLSAAAAGKSAWEQFEWQDCGGGLIALRSPYWGTYVSVNPGEADHPLKAASPNGGPAGWEFFSWGE
ncbi:discoidin domain-containing protein [Paenibacillus sp. S150]|uniref:discoidin domain-containing protein n=1 Tax=Paenibacillus sp. S150 TaxID=2749826 RepID=UPI001C56D47D|nr:discoidin domain-containing protein [Paenibacillus sp. S150]MBW4079929.1 discoidin domain-containing protein [Paenibacillus sp. S150]